MNAAPIGSPDSPASVAPIGPFFGFLICRDPAGTDWLARLLAATPRGRTTLGEMVDSPGQLPIRALPAKVTARRLLSTVPDPTLLPA